jgi:sortase B
MIKILIQVKDNSMHFKVRKKLKNEYRNMLNTNIISDNEILFSDEYILDNLKIVSSFLNQLAVQSGVNIVVIEVEDIISLVLSLVKNIPTIDSIILANESPLNYKDCEKIQSIKHIKSLNCYFLPQFMLEGLNRKGIIVESRSEILTFSEFMEMNSLNSLSSIYYKSTLIIQLPMSKLDMEDFENFCSINNNYLKTIHLKYLNIADLEFILTTLKAYKKRNIKIVIHEDKITPEILSYLQKYKEKQSKKTKIYIRVAYSTRFIEENLLLQTNVNILKTCCLFAILIITCVFGYVFYDNYKVAKEVEGIQNNIRYIMDTTDTTELVNNINELNANTELVVQNKEIVSLTTTNKESVGWLKVPNTNIDYAVVQHSDNEYYLKHSFDRRPSNAGWVFMDYRNDPVNLDDNTIIYAHNRYSNGTMFGTLGYALKKDWYSKEENLFITFSTIYKKYTFRIFSVYKTPYTIDYLTIQFYDALERLDFYNMLKNRSINNFGVNLVSKDKIITLSTCSDDGGRIVVHGVLVKEE